jgi:hypothetical protein
MWKFVHGKKGAYVHKILLLTYFLFYTHPQISTLLTAKVALTVFLKLHIMLCSHEISTK